MWKLTKERRRLHIRWIRGHSGDVGNSIADRLSDAGTRQERQHRWWRRTPLSGGWDEEGFIKKVVSVQRERETTVCQEALETRWTGPTHFPRTDTASHKFIPALGTLTTAIVWGAVQRGNELRKDLRGLGKPPSFDGNDAEYQDFRFSFRVHMSLVSTVSQPLMDKCDVERNPISLAAVKVLRDAHLKCCIQMYFSLALRTKGSVRTLVRSVAESNGAEAWRLIHSRYAPDTQNRQYVLMQKIMMPAKRWCDHAVGFESGLRAWELDVGEWERASETALADAVKYTVMMNMAPVFLRNRLQLGTYPNSAALRAALLQWCYSSRNFGANPTVSAGNGTSADDDRMQVDSLKKGKGKGKGKNQHQRGSRTTSTTNTTNTSSTDINTCKNCGRTGHRAKDCWRPGGGACDNSTCRNTGKGKSHKKGKGKADTWTLWKRISLLKQPQLCRILHKHRVSLENSRAIQTWNRGSWV